jgi:Xaa-Pro aminopeptidase
MKRMDRLQIFRENLRKSQVDGMIVTHPENRRYLSGFTGSAGILLIGPDRALLAVDFRYWEQAALEAESFETVKSGKNLFQGIAEQIAALNWRTVGFEPEGLTYRDYQDLRGILPELVELKPLPDFISQQRGVKEPAEIELLAKAARITDLAWKKTLQCIKPGIKESEVGLEFDYQLRLNGAEGSAFDTIVASGPRAALPHAAPTDRKIRTGDLVIIDGGAKYRGYHGDMTRTVVLGKADSKQREIYRIVLEAQRKALESIRPGVIGKVVDAVARDYISAEGYGEYFGHGLGHSVGLNIHENPRFSPYEEQSIPAGTVITVEPGIYVPEWGGVRIEDLVVVEENGIRNLTGSPKRDLIEL